MIYVMRHAAAEAGGAGNDAARPLTPSGREDALEVGRCLRSLGARPAVVLCSPLARARETADLLRGAFVPAPRVEARDALASGAGASDLWREGSAAAGEGADVIVVAHNPEAASLAAAPMGPGSVACLEPVDGQPRVRWVRTPAVLAAVARQA